MYISVCKALYNLFHFVFHLILPMSIVFSQFVQSRNKYSPMLQYAPCTNTALNTTDRLWISADMTAGWQIGSGTRIFSKGIISPVSRAFHGHRRQLRQLHIITHNQLHCRLLINLSLNQTNTFLNWATKYNCWSLVSSQQGEYRITMCEW